MVSFSVSITRGYKTGFSAFHKTGFSKLSRIWLDFVVPEAIMRMFLSYMVIVVLTGVSAYVMLTEISAVVSLSEVVI